MKELSNIDKALNKADVSSRLYIVMLIIWNIITKPKKWEFHDGGFGMPHFHDYSCVMIRYPLIPIYFEISFYHQDAKIYPILFYPIFLVLFFYVAICRLLLINGC